ncbi:MAG TPA: hypothetical protein VLK33_15330 [Terriglobales bacterium]|nr:hypothetical protein [Terriglobales bacterium]
MPSVHSWAMLSPLNHIIIDVIFFVLIPLAIVGTRMVWRMSKEVTSEDWPVIQGRCTFAGIEYKDGHYELRVLYTYKVPQEKFPGCGVFYKDFFDQSAANRWANVLRDKEFPVHYNANQPDKSNLMSAELESIVDRLN